MKMIDLFEAPISDLQILSQDGDFGGRAFSAVDKKILTSPKGRAKIIRAFSKTPHDFRVIFHNSNKFDGEGSDNERVDDLASRDAGIYKDAITLSGGLKVEPAPGVITVVILANLSPLDEKKPMTAWTLAHKIGHSIQDDLGQTGYSKVFLKAIYSIVATMTGRWNRHGELYLPLSQNLTMKSARDGKLKNEFESFAEMTAQYLVTGRITLKRPHHNELRKKYEDKLNKTYKEFFDGLAGKIMVEL